MSGKKGGKTKMEDVAQSANPAELKRRELKELLPEAFSEGRLDVEALKRALGEDFIESGERYRLDWAGKSDAYKVLQTPTTATLRPQRDKSVNFDTAQHVFIEGENLETLKVLQKAYFGKVKMIYIDPPYNTGNDSFIYPDRFQENKEEYLKRINELSDDGTLMREGFFRKNNRESGHYHSNWLSMMLPRLYIARNLLRDDGVIFVSCDDNEMSNLRSLMNEIFGEENFIATVIWQKVYAPKSSAKYFSEDHDYILLYTKNLVDWSPELLPRTDEQDSVYKNPDDDPRGRWRPNNLAARNYYSKGTYSINCPSGRVIEGPPSGSYWRMSKEKLMEMNNQGRIYWGKDGNNVPAPKIYLSEVKQGRVPQTLWKYDEVGHTQEAKKELLSLVDFPDSSSVFDTPKPTRLIRRMLQLATDTDEPALVMDFFAGSGTTLDAVMQQNAEDGGKRSCILVQLPERLEGTSGGLDTIAEIARQRIAKAIKQLESKADLVSGATDGIGYKSFLLSLSNFKQWRGEGIATGEELAEQLQMFVKSEKEGADTESVLYELLLKFGQELITPVEQFEIAGKRVFAIHERGMLFVLEDFTEDMIDPLLALKPREVIALDSVFHDSDELKTNFDLQCHDADVKFICI
ncbi:MAG: site-specific DNA-methyltransferase [Gammaproteobacteria bacterium]